MKGRLVLFFVLVMLSVSAAAQFATTADKQKNNNSQRAIDDQMANNFFKLQEYDKARDLYRNLYGKYRQAHYFVQYTECLLYLKEYPEAEKSLKDYIKDNPNQWKAKVDLIYVYRLEDKNDKADKQLSDILNALPNDRNIILTIQNMFLARQMAAEALAVIDKGSTIVPDKYPFYMEKAFIYRTMADYQKVFEYYFLELEAVPSDYNLIKNQLQVLLFYDVNSNIADQMRMALLKKTQEKPENVEFAQLLVWFALQEEEYDIALAQCISIDKRMGEQESQILNLSDICLSNNQFDIAKEGYGFVSKKGNATPFYSEAIVGLINTEYKEYAYINVTDKKVYQSLSKRIDDALGEVSSDQVSKLAIIQADILAYHLDNPEAAGTLLEQTLQNAGSNFEQAQVKLALADNYLYRDNVWEATLLYSQVDKSMKEEPLGHEARFKNAQLRYYIGEFAWAQTQLKILEAATSKLIANDAMTLSLIIKDNLEADTTGKELRRIARADFKISQHKDSDAVIILDSVMKDGNYTSIPHALYRKAEMEERHGNHLMADSLYTRIFTVYPDSYMADDALMKAALTEQDHLNNKEAAMHHYEMLIDNYPTSIYTSPAKKNYRKLQ